MAVREQKVEGGRKESAQMFKTKYFQRYSVFSKIKVKHKNGLH